MLNSKSLKKELGKLLFRLFTKNIAISTYLWFILPSDNFNGRGILTVQR